MLLALALAAWPLVFKDDFNGTALNERCWHYEVERSGNDPVNELQRFTKSATVADGVLSITARKEMSTGESGPKAYTSSQIYSTPTFRYGRFEARIKVPKGAGLWPTFWLLPDHSVYGWHPKSGEIDIMEMIGREPQINFGVVHYYNFEHQKHYSQEARKRLWGNYYDDYHVFGLEWRPGKLTWFLDGKPYFTVTKWSQVPGQSPHAPFDQTFKVVLNLSVGGTWGGPPTASTRFPASMKVDWVRVYSPEEVRYPC